MLTRADLTDSKFISPPGWMANCLERLCKATGYRGAVGIAVLEGAWPERVGVTDQPHGFVWKHQDSSLKLIILPKWAEESDKWKSLICHEFVHVLMASIDEYVRSLLSDEQVEEYMRRVEAAMKPLSLIAMITQVVNVEWVEDGEHDGES